MPDKDVVEVIAEVGLEAAKVTNDEVVENPVAEEIQEAPGLSMKVIKSGG